jgi:hypothetical protein
MTQKLFLFLICGFLACFSNAKSDEGSQYFEGVSMKYRMLGKKWP